MFDQAGMRRAVFGPLLGAALSAGVGCGTAAAQQAADAADGVVLLDEIVVTAQKRAEDVQDVPISMSAFSGDQLGEMGVERVSDLMAHVPNVDFFSFFGEAQTPSLCFRSVCLNQQFSDSFEAPVAMYTDEVYVGSAFAQALQLFDIERVEVLKGPQGTLYGRNTTGGLVNVVTRKPTDTLDMRLGLEYGSYDTKIAEAAIGGPIAGGVRGRIAARVHQADGWVDGAHDGVESGDTDTVAVRGMLDIPLGDDASFLLAAHYFKVDQDAEPSAIGGTVNPLTGEQCNLQELETGNCVGIFDTGESANSLYGRYEPGRWLGADIPGGVEPRNYVEDYGVTGTLSWSFGDVHLTSISAFSDSSKDYIEDLDGSIQYQFDDRLFADAQTLSQEIRLDGEYSGIGWLLGAFYYDDERDVGTTLFPVSYYEDRSTKNTESWAVYANLDIPMPGYEQLHLLLGGRYTDEERDVVLSRSGDFTSPVEGTRREVGSSNLDWKVALQWQPMQDLMVYGSATTSFRSANMNNQFIFGNVNPASTLDSLRPVSPEYLTAYEVGFKSDFWDGRARLNASTFYYDIEDMQFLIFVFDPTLGLGASRLRNIDDVNVWGAELDLTLVPIDNLELRFAGGITESEIKSDAIVVVNDEDVSVRGNELPFSNPAFTASASYTVDVANGSALRFNVGYSWKDDHYFSIANVPTGQGAAYGLLDLSVGWTSPSGQLSVEAYGDNLLDEEYYVYTGTVYPDTVNAVWGRPTWWGLKFNYRY